MHTMASNARTTQAVGLPQTTIVGFYNRMHLRAAWTSCHPLHSSKNRQSNISVCWK